MNIFEKVHAFHRIWRYRLHSERDEISFLMSRNLSGQTVVDIGANRGVYSYWMYKKVGSTGSVIAFEPQPELADYLQDLKRSFGLKHLTIVNLGLSSVKGQRQLVRPKEHWGRASLELHQQPDTDCLNITVTTLDEYFLQNSDKRPVRFIKCDVEGHEYEVFKGGEQILKEDRPDLVFECHDHLAKKGKLFMHLESLDYDGFFFMRKELVPISQYHNKRSSIRKPYLNYIFLA